MLDWAIYHCPPHFCQQDSRNSESDFRIRYLIIRFLAELSPYVVDCREYGKYLDIIYKLCCLQIKAWFSTWAEQMSEQRARQADICQWIWYDVATKEFYEILQIFLELLTQWQADWQTTGIPADWQTGCALAEITSPDFTPPVLSSILLLSSPSPLRDWVPTTTATSS